MEKIVGTSVPQKTEIFAFVIILPNPISIYVGGRESGKASDKMTWICNIALGESRWASFSRKSDKACQLFSMSVDRSINFGESDLKQYFAAVQTLMIHMKSAEKL